jgi:hypothetical protein
MSLSHARLNTEQIQEFKKLYKEYYNIELSDEEAMDRGNHFIQFIGLVIENNDEFCD